MQSVLGLFKMKVKLHSFTFRVRFCDRFGATDSPLMTVTRKEHGSAAAELHHDGLVQSERASPAKKKKKK